MTTVLPGVNRLVEHEIGPGQRCMRCGADYSWFAELPTGTLALGLRDRDNGPVYALPFTLTGRRIERCDPDGPIYPPRIRMVTAWTKQGVLVIKAYERVTG